MRVERFSQGDPKRVHSQTLVPAPPTRSPSVRPALRALLTGMRATVPLALPIVPYMTLYGVTAIAAGLSPLAAQALALLVFSGAVLPAAQALSSGTPLLVVGGMIAVLNLRHLLYSARLAPQMRQLPLPRRLLLSYGVTDESHAVTHQYAQAHGRDRRWWLVLLGSGLVIWVVAQGATALGVFLGTQLPLPASLADVTLTLTYLAFLVLSLKRGASLCAALAAGVAALALSHLPLRLGVFVAILLGITAGVLAQRVRGQRATLLWAKEEDIWQPGS